MRTIYASNMILVKDEGQETAGQNGETVAGPFFWGANGPVRRLLSIGTCAGNTIYYTPEGSSVINQTTHLIRPNIIGEDP
jgi:hypothetical protein